MSFVPAPQQATSAILQNAAASNNKQISSSTPATATSGGAPEVADGELIFRLRTFDVFWVEKRALMYKDGITKVSKLTSFMDTVVAMYPNFLFTMTLLRTIRDARHLTRYRRRR